MQKISLICDEAADLPKEIIEKYGMASVPYVVDWKDGDDLPGDPEGEQVPYGARNIYQKMREAEKRGIKELPKTSQPSPWTFKKIFEKELEKSEKILCITLSSKLSGGYNSALQGRGMLKTEEQKRIYIIDCLNVSAGEGLFALKAKDLINEGKDIEEVIKELKEFILKTHLIGMLEDPKWLEAGGRLSHPLAALIRQMQKIGMRPLIGVKDGVVKSVALRTQAKDMPTALFKELKRETKGEKVRVAITHADNLEGANKLKKLIEKELSLKIVFLNLIDFIVGVHVGPGTIIVAWAPI